MDASLSSALDSALIQGGFVGGASNADHQAVMDSAAGMDEMVDNSNDPADPYNGPSTGNTDLA